MGKLTYQAKKEETDSLVLHDHSIHYGVQIVLPAEKNEGADAAKINKYLEAARAKGHTSIRIVLEKTENHILEIPIPKNYKELKQRKDEFIANQEAAAPKPASAFWAEMSLHTEKKDPQ